MNAETTKKLHALVRLCNESIVEPDRAACNAQAIKAELIKLIADPSQIIKAELIKLIADPSAANAPRNKVQVIRLPDAEALAFNKAAAPELPRLTAYVSSCDYNTLQKCKIYLGNDVLAKLTVYRGRSCAVSMVRMALKGAISHFGKRRRHTANQRKKEGK